MADLDSDTWVGEVKRIQGKEAPLTAAGVRTLRAECTRTIVPTRALAAEALNLEHPLSDVVHQYYGQTPAEITLMWQTAPPLDSRARAFWLPLARFTNWFVAPIL